MFIKTTVSWGSNERNNPKNLFKLFHLRMNLVIRGRDGGGGATFRATLDLFGILKQF